MTGRLVRPAYHLTPGAGWLNDPLGVTVRPDGVHVFFQHVPDRPEWRIDCHWGHAVSRDLLRWTERPVALAPDADEAGCWSGCVVPGTDLLLYTAVSAPVPDLGRVRAATATDDGWDGWAKGAVLVEAPEGLGLVHFRDPFVFQDGSTWRMLVGAGLAGDVAAALSFTSDDLAAWTYDGVLAQRAASEAEGGTTGSVWECPQLVVVDGTTYLVVSVWRDGVTQHVACARGELRDGRFHAAEWQRLSTGDGHYAATVLHDGDGRPGLLHWLRGVGDPAAGWAGALSVPHVLSVVDGLLAAAPHPAVAAARQEPTALGTPLTDGARLDLPSWHVETMVDVTAGRAVGLAWCGPGGGPALLDVSVGADGGCVVSADGTPPVHLDDGARASGPVTVLLDGCLAEVFLGPAGVVSVPVRAAAGDPPPYLRATSGAPTVSVWGLAV